MGLKRGLVISNANDDTDIKTCKAYKASITRISRHYDDLKNPIGLVNEVKILHNNALEWVLLTGHSLDELNKSSVAIPYIHDLLVLLDKQGLPYPKYIILGNETNELQQYWHNEAKRLSIRFPKVMFLPQSCTSIAERAGYETITNYLKNTKDCFNDLVIHFYLRPTWKFDCWFDNLKRINRLLDILVLTKRNYIHNVHIMESHDGDSENPGGDLVISSYFGERVLSFLSCILSISSRFHYNSGGLNNKYTTVLTGCGKKDYLASLWFVLSCVVLSPYFVYTLLRIALFKIKY